MAFNPSLTENPHPYGRDNTQRRFMSYGVAAIAAGSVYVANGLPLAWSQLQGVPTTQVRPADAFFYSELAGGYSYVFDKTHNTLRIFNGGQELGAGAAIAADTIDYAAEWVRGV